MRIETDGGLKDTAAVYRANSKGSFGDNFGEDGADRGGFGFNPFASERLPSRALGRGTVAPNVLCNIAHGS
jgi:hypothetical protein